MLLDIKNIDVLYDDFQVIWDVSINVDKAEMVALLGPNGSGKSTILNTISNLVEHKNGTINFENNLISNIPTYKELNWGFHMCLKEEEFFHT
jgi:branched-chain amino acid transport system ATP-binding protein